MLTKAATLWAQQNSKNLIQNMYIVQSKANCLKKASTVTGPKVGEKMGQRKNNHRKAYSDESRPRGCPN